MYWHQSQIVGANLRKLRRDRGISIYELGSFLGISPSNIVHLENGKHSNPMKSPFINKLCRYFEVKPETLLEIKSWDERNE